MEYGVAGLSFRVLSLVQRPSDSTNCLGGVMISQSRWSTAGNAVFHGSSAKKMSRRVFTLAPSLTFSCTAGDTVPLPGTHRVSKTTSGDPFEMQKTFGPAKGKIKDVIKDCLQNHKSKCLFDILEILLKCKKLSAQRRANLCFSVRVVWKTRVRILGRHCSRLGRRYN